MKINVSEILDFQKCPSYWASKWVFKRALKGARAPALDVGRATHLALEEMLKTGQPKTGRITAALLQDWATRGLPEDQEALRDARHLEYWISFLMLEPLWDDVLGTELALEKEIAPDLTLIGRLDAVVRVRGKLRHLQWKTIAPSTPWDVFSRVKQRSLHEGAYGELGREHFGPDFAGTLLIGIRKLAHHEREKGAVCAYCGDKGYKERNPDVGIYWSDLLVDHRKTTRATDQIREIAGRIREERERLLKWRDTRGTVIPIEQREQACGGLYGNSLCSYVETCDGNFDLWDGFMYEDIDPMAGYKEGNENADSERNPIALGTD